MLIYNTSNLRGKMKHTDVVATRIERIRNNIPLYKNITVAVMLYIIQAQLKCFIYENRRVFYTRPRNKKSKIWNINQIIEKNVKKIKRAHS